MRLPLWRLCLLVGLLGMILVGPTPADDPARDRELKGNPADLRPQWHVGDRWVVETATRPLHAADAEQARNPAAPVRWEFAVKAVERIAGRGCYRVEIRSRLTGRPQPKTTLWIDRRTSALRRLETQLPVAGQFRTVTENYRWDGGQASPVLGPLPALPVDMPLFLGGRVKGPETFRYETAIGPPGEKALDDLRFAFEVEQRFSQPKSADVKGLLPEAFAKDLPRRPLVEVRLEGFDCRVRQLWQPGRPWPTYADNGSTVARLVEVIPASSQSNQPPEAQ